jgi:hypothetical protein
MRRGVAEVVGVEVRDADPPATVADRLRDARVGELPALAEPQVQKVGVDVFLRALR